MTVTLSFDRLSVGRLPSSYVDCVWGYEPPTNWQDQTAIGRMRNDAGPRPSMVLVPDPLLSPPPDPVAGRSRSSIEQADLLAQIMLHHPDLKRDGIRLEYDPHLLSNVHHRLLSELDTTPGPTLSIAILSPRTCP